MHCIKTLRKFKPFRSINNKPINNNFQIIFLSNQNRVERGLRRDGRGFPGIFQKVGDGGDSLGRRIYCPRGLRVRDLLIFQGKVQFFIVKSSKNPNDALLLYYWWNLFIFFSYRQAFLVQQWSKFFERAFGASTFTLLDSSHN